MSEKLIQQAQSESFVVVHQEGMCVECLDQPAGLTCEQCEDDYCDVCSGALHRKGNRAKHTFKPLNKPAVASPTPATAISTSVSRTSSMAMTDDAAPKDTNKKAKTESIYAQYSNPTDDEVDIDLINTIEDIPDDIRSCFHFYPYFKSRLQYIPLRLSDAERSLLRILEDALMVSEYTDKVDNMGQRDRLSLQIDGIKSILSTLTGLYLANDHKVAKKVFATGDFAENAAFYKTVFEIGRRHKIRNPDKMRSTFGKLCAIAQDSNHPTISAALGFSLVSPILTVYSDVQRHKCLGILEEPLLEFITAPFNIYAENAEKMRTTALKLRTAATDELIDKYVRATGGAVTADHIRLWLSSISDHHSYLTQALAPLQRLHQLLHLYFDPNEAVTRHILSITAGKGTARLTHNHATQFMFVHQTLTLWQEIIYHMYQLWFEADLDLLTNPHYNIRFTGQGMHRMQGARAVGKTMQRILECMFRKFPNWIGSSAVHLGDTNVPNALVFIDKYTQLERILSPIDHTLREIKKAIDINHPHLGKWFKYYYSEDINDDKKNQECLHRAGEDQLEKHGEKVPYLLISRILVDFFRYAFDGSGADDYFSAGSCIDGRLTSAWNWCSRIAKKSYHKAFLATGFNGFDG